MGDATAGPVRLSFNPQLRVEFHGATVTSDAGLLALGAMTPALAAARREHVPTFTHFLDISILFVIVALGAARPTTWMLFTVATVVALLSDAGLARAAGNESRAHLDAPLVRDGRPHGGAELPGTRSPQYGPRAA